MNRRRIVLPFFLLSSSVGCGETKDGAEERGRASGGASFTIGIGGTSAGAAAGGSGAAAGGSGAAAGGSGGTSSVGNRCSTDFGIDGAQRLDELSDDQALAVCTSFYGGFECVYPSSYLCRLSALSVAASLVGQDAGGDASEMCREIEAECLDDDEGFGDAATNCRGTVAPALCSATVAEYEECYRQIFAIAEQSVQTFDFTCDQVSEFLAWSETENRELPELCLSFDTGCDL